MTPVALDTSALTTVLLGEPEAEEFARVLLRHRGELILSAATRLELGIVVQARQGPSPTQDLLVLLERLAVKTIPFDAAQAEIALAAWRRFGKGRHPAGLNLGDCYSYALAKTTGAPLLFKGNNFRQNDIAAAL